MASSVVESGPTDQECRALVQRIIASNEFHRASRLRDFLLYVVDRKLADATREVTEPLIGHRVFGRPASYNTGEDSIVRTEARVLRQRLANYFSKEGVNEPIVLQIPKGSYIPVFYWREPSVPPPPAEPAPLKRSLNWGKWLIIVAGAIAAATLFWFLAVPRSSHFYPATAARSNSNTPGAVELESSDPQLVRSFEWAKQRALGYTYTGDPVGNWYDSTAGNRYAFCMRDVSHQSVGAAVLGLNSHTRNMLRRFAASISASRDWCGFWEINKDGFPAPIDYENDRHFWYCLPANFDVMQACYRQYLWTGDQGYFDSVFSNFYDRTVTDYVAAWDRDQDGVMESSPKAAPRGIPSYYQQEPKPWIGADLLAAQYKGYLVYAAIQRHKGSRGSLSERLAEEYLAKAQSLRTRYNTGWWNPVQNRHYSAMLESRQFYPGYIDEGNVFALLFGLTEEGLKTDAALDSLEKNRPEFDQKLTYFPEVLFEYGRNDDAYRYLLELTDANFRGRGMPEAVFAAIGAVATGLAGISPDAARGIIETLPRLPKAVDWVTLKRIPVLQNEVTVAHRGLTATSITNLAGPPLIWKASFPIHSASMTPQLLVDGAPAHSSIEQRVNRQLVASVEVALKSGQTRTVRVTGTN